MSKDKIIWDYFEDNIDYPKAVAHDPLPYGTAWNYISSTFLNGFINYVTPIKVYQIDRYTHENAGLEVEYGERQNLEAGWKKLCFTKAELRKLVVEEKIYFAHTNLHVFGDDIIVLAQITGGVEPDGKERYMFFWFDCDVSDCSIGKFETTDTQEMVIQSLLNFLDRERKRNQGIVIEPEDGLGFEDNGVVNYTELPLSFLQGWLQF